MLLLLLLEAGCAAGACPARDTERGASLARVEDAMAAAAVGPVRDNIAASTLVQLCARHLLSSNYLSAGRQLELAL